MNADLVAALSLGASAFLIGLTGAMSPGPYLTMTISRTVTRGPGSAALMLVGHALLEGMLLLGFAFGLQAVLAAPAVHSALSVAGGGFLIWMSVGLLRSAVRGTLSAQSTPAPVKESRLGSVLQGAAVSLSNPYWSLWWATISVKRARCSCSTWVRGSYLKVSRSSRPLCGDYCFTRAKSTGPWGRTHQRASRYRTL